MKNFRQRKERNKERACDNRPCVCHGTAEPTLEIESTSALEHLPFAEPPPFFVPPALNEKPVKR